ncbi:MAG TPA: discoidin domain-containing protein, partial [Ignavibacteriaceae bacterium]
MKLYTENNKIIFPLGLLLLTFFLFSYNTLSQEKMLESFNTSSALSDWKIYKADGVEAEISLAEGYSGKGIKFDYNFTKGTGYGGIQKLIPLDLPENFQFSFYLKAESPANNFEFKLIDNSGNNVWWVNNRNYSFPTEWTKIKIKKRHINFAWGPTQDKSLKRIDRLEFTIASYVGGKGSVYIDELKFEELPDENQHLPEPTFSASTELNEHSIKFISDKNPETYWQSVNKYDQFVEVDFHQIREFGGIVINWLKGQHAEDFSLWTSRDKDKWEEVYSVESFKGGNSFIPLKEEETRYLRIHFHHKIGTDGFAIKEIEIKDIQFSITPNDFFINVAKKYPRGYYPRYFNEEGTF